MAQADTECFLMDPDNLQDQVDKGNGDQQGNPTPKIEDDIDIKLAVQGSGTSLPEPAR